MAKLAVSIMVDIAISDELSGTPPYERLFSIPDEIENIISDGCDAEGFSYTRVGAGIEKQLLDETPVDFIYEITEDE